MKRYYKGLLAVLINIICLTGCSLQYDSFLEKDGMKYGCSKKEAFACEYYWDGKEESMTILIPESVEGRKVVSIGGSYGRGLPCFFTVVMPPQMEIEGQWLNMKEDRYGEADESILLEFEVKSDLPVKRCIDEDRHYYQTGEKRIEYVVSIRIVGDEETASEESLER